MKLEAAFTINGDVVEQIGKIKSILFFRVLSSGSDSVYLVNEKDNNVIGEITCGMSQGCGFIDEVRELE